jgi:hypothetical protein
MQEYRTNDKRRKGKKRNIAERMKRLKHAITMEGMKERQEERRK